MELIDKNNEKYRFDHPNWGDNWGTNHGGWNGDGWTDKWDNNNK
jgi:hypothetical protein